MTEMRKITAFVPARLLASAQAHSGAGVTETLRQALEMMAYERFYEGLRSAQGTLKADEINLEDLREDREFDRNGNVIR